MTKFVLKLMTIALFLGGFSLEKTYAAGSELNEAFKDKVVADPETHKRVSLYQYGYNDREHSFAENAKTIGVVYGLTWFFYPVVQPKVFQGAGGVNEYSRNIGKLVFDQDEPFWNDLVHPLSGSQLYLLYRANGYDRLTAFQMTFISSALFEFTVETFTEPASVQDLYQTPVFGTFLGFGLENASMYLLNSGNTVGKILGHALNPATLFPFYEGRTFIIPKFNDEDKGAMIRMELNY